MWRERARTVTGKGMPGGHNLQEGAPAEVLAELRSYLRTAAATPLTRYRRLIRMRRLDFVDTSVDVLGAAPPRAEVTGLQQGEAGRRLVGEQ